MHFIQIGSWIFDTKAQQIRCTKQTVQLEPISSALLLYLCQNCKRNVTRENLIAYVWNNRVVSDSTINRAISILRKHLGDDPQNPSYIRTVHKQGYILQIPIKELNEEEKLLHQHNKPVNTIFSVNIHNIFTFSLLVLVSVMSISTFLNSKDIPVLTDRVTMAPILTEKGQEAFISLSPNDEFIIYSHSERNGSFYHLYQKDLTTGKVIQLTDGEHNDFGASIDAQNSTVYFSRLTPDKSCYIMQRSLLLAGTTKAERITECNKSLGNTNVEIHPNNNDVYYIDNVNGLYVYRYNMKTKEKVRMSNLKQSRLADYYHKLSPDGNNMITIGFGNGNNLVVLKRLNQADNEQVLWSSNGPPMPSVSWSKDSNQIYFFEKRLNQLVSYNLSNNQISVHALENNLLNALSNQQENGDVYAVLGNQTQYDISSIPLSSSYVDKRELLVASTANDIRAVQVNKQNTFYVSDRSGMYQFWLRNNEGLETQLSNFKENRHYLNFSADPLGEYVVGLTDGRLFQFTFATKEFKWLTDKSIRASHPMFSPEGRLHYIAKGDSNRLVKYNVNEEGTQVILGAVYAEYLAENILYQDEKGDVYLFKEGGNTHILMLSNVKDLTNSAQQRNWIGSEKGIYFTKRGNDSNRGLYFQSFDKSPPRLISSVVTDDEPNPFGSLSYDRFNQRILLETEEDVNTNIVKLVVNKSLKNNE